jgi:hypothetical protein
MAKACAQWRPADHYLVTGTGTERFTRPLFAAGVGHQNVQCIDEASGAEIIEAIARVTDQDTMILGMGNIAGPGISLIDFFHETALWTPRDAMSQEELETSDSNLSTSPLSLKAA